MFNRWSSFTKLRRITAWCLRFINNTRKRDKVFTKNLSVSELKSSTMWLVKLSQKIDFHDDIKILQSKIDLPKNSKLLSLSPFLDSQQVLRVGGRLKHANISFNQRHPILLSSSSKLSYLIATNCHKKYLHAGCQAVLTHLRQQYWIISAKNLVKKIIRECIVCFRAKPIHISPYMGNLPSDRVNLTSPFRITGVDYGGPMLVREFRRRGRVHEVKCYLAVFICFFTKGVHLELVSSLTSEAFLAALKRFISRRPKCKVMYSDHGSNFVGARNELKELHQFLSSQPVSNKIERQLADQCITWKFIPPKSPSFGGLWEASVRSVKHHIKRVIGNTLLTFEEYYTLLTQIEFCLNQRPLTPLSSDPTDLNPLTPSHFLYGDSYDELPDTDF